MTFYKTPPASPSSASFSLRPIHFTAHVVPYAQPRSTRIGGLLLPKPARRQVATSTLSHNLTHPQSLVPIHSHISRKFRGIILYSPSLWVSIPLTLMIPAWLVGKIIDWSAPLELTLDIQLQGTTGSFYTKWIRLSSESVLSRLFQQCSTIMRDEKT